MSEVSHGTRRKYQSEGCRCEACRAANAESQRGYRSVNRSTQASLNAARLAEGIDPHPAHLPEPSANTYKHHGCRCPRCTEAWRIDDRQTKERRQLREIAARLATVLGGTQQPTSERA